MYVMNTAMSLIRNKCQEYNLKVNTLYDSHKDLKNTKLSIALMVGIISLSNLFYHRRVYFIANYLNCYIILTVFVY